MTDLTNVTTEELAREINKRRVDELEEFARLAPNMTDEMLDDITRQQECEFERIYEYSPPANHCRGCIADAELGRRVAEKERLKREKPGKLPSTCNSARSGDALDLRVGDVLERRLYPGADKFDYVEVLSTTISKDGEKKIRVEFRRTNDPNDEVFSVDYPYLTFIRTIHGKF